MFNLIKTSAAVCLLLVANSSLALSTTSGHGYSLEALFKLAVEANPNIEQSFLQTQKAQAKVGESQAQLGPQVKVQSELSYAWMQMDDFGRTANQLQVTYPVFNPSLSDSQEIASLSLESQTQAYEAAQQQIFMQLAQVYFNYWQTHAQKQYLENEQAFLQETIKQLKQRMRVGYKGLEEVLELQARLAQTKSDLVAVKANLGFSLNNLEQLTGKPLAQISLEPLKVTSVTKAQIKAYQSAQYAIASHPSIRALNHKKQAKLKAELKAKNLDGVQVELFGNIAYNDSGNRYYDDMRGTRAGVRLQMPLYLGGATDYRVQQAQSETSIVNAQIREQQLMLEKSFKNALLALQSLQNQVAALKASYKAQKTVLNATKQAIYTGKKSFVDLINVQRELNRIERNLAILNADLGMQKIKIDWSLGQLTLKPKHS